MKFGICIFTAQDFLSIDDYCGGEYRYLLKIAVCLSEMGHEVVVIIENNKAEFNESNIRFIKYDRCLHSKHREIGRHWACSLESYGHEPLEENRLESFDVFIAQNSDFLNHHIFRYQAKNIIFCLGKPEGFDWEKSDCILTYDPVVSYWCMGNNLNSEIIYPYIDELNSKKKNKNLLLSASTELYRYIGFDINYEIFLSAKSIIPTLIYKHYYVRDWIDINLSRDPNQDVIDYFREYEIFKKLMHPIDGFKPTEFKDYNEYQSDLCSAGFYLHGRGDIKSLAGNEAMFHGVCTINPKKPHMMYNDFAINIDFDYSKPDERKVAIKLATQRLVESYFNEDVYDNITKLQMEQTVPHRKKESVKMKLKVLIDSLY